MSEATGAAKEILPKLKIKVEESMQIICNKWLNVNLSCYNKKLNQFETLLQWSQKQTKLKNWTYALPTLTVN